MQFYYVTALLAGLVAATPIAEPLDARGFPSRNRPTTTGAVTRPTTRARSPPWAQIVVASANGDGCPGGGSVSGVFSNYNTMLSLTFAAFKVGQFAGANPSTYNDRNKQCNLAVRLNAPQGWTYTASTVFYTGHVRLPTPQLAQGSTATAECLATLNTTYTQNGVAAPATSGGGFAYSSMQANVVTPPATTGGTPTVTTGTYDTDFNATSTLTSNYSPCTNGNAQAGPVFNINTKAAVNCNGDPDVQGAILNIDSENTNFVAGIQFTWQQCTPGQTFAPGQVPGQMF